MTLSQYGWDGENPAIIKQHSVAKHEVLREYLVAYLQTLVVSPGQDAMSATLIDGFAGGGLYVHEDTREYVLGSPFVFLQAAQEAKAILELNRRKPLELKLDYFFVEKDKRALSYLRRNLAERGYAHRLDVDVRLLGGKFEDHFDPILSFIKAKSPRNGRSIFLLDQYGYKDVPTLHIRRIFSALPSAEVILTFGVDSFINFAEDSRRTDRILKRIDIPDPLKGRTFADIWMNEADARLYIQSCMHQSLVNSCGAKYFTVFFIRTTGHGDYWLVHLSQHPRARDVMSTVHWNKNTHFIHYGGAGLDMFRALGYVARSDSSFTGQGELGFCFDEQANAASVHSLKNQLAPVIHEYPNGIRFGTLFSSTCNSTPANSERYRVALEGLIAEKEISVQGTNGESRRRASTIRDSDLITRARQHTLWSIV